MNKYMAEVDHFLHFGRGFPLLNYHFRRRFVTSCGCHWAPCILVLVLEETNVVIPANVALIAWVAGWTEALSSAYGQVISFQLIMANRLNPPNVHPRQKYRSNNPSLRKPMVNKPVMKSRIARCREGFTMFHQPGFAWDKAFIARRGGSQVIPPANLEIKQGGKDSLILPEIIQWISASDGQGHFVGRISRKFSLAFFEKKQLPVSESYIHKYLPHVFRISIMVRRAKVYLYISS